MCIRDRRKSGAGYDFIWRKAPTRTNLKVFDRSCGVVTEFNAPGEAVSEEEIGRMSELIAHRARRADVLVLSGSMPPACPANYYAGVIRAVAGEKCLCVLDADGAPLFRRKGLARGVFHGRGRGLGHVHDRRLRAPGPRRFRSAASNCAYGKDLELA